jgi:hypothetical protein
MMNQTIKQISLVCGALIGAGLASSPSFAATITFGAETNGVQIENYFNGGTDSLGKSGTNVGVSFSLNAESLRAGVTGTQGQGTGKFENLPSGAPGVLYFAAVPTNTTSIMDVAAGFSGISFSYSLLNNSASDASTVQLWSGLDGTGTMLGTLSLTASGKPVACTNLKDEFCSWSSASLGNLGLAKSAVFTGNGAVFTEYDNLQVIPTPLPGGLFLLVSGFGGLLGFFRKRKCAEV